MPAFSSLSSYGELLTHLRFSDAIVLIAETTNQLQAMLHELDNQNSTVGLKINRMKPNSYVPKKHHRTV